MCPVLHFVETVVEVNQAEFSQTEDLLQVLQIS